MATTSISGDMLREERSGVFISHIAEEKPVAIVLQRYLKLAFGQVFRVFVSSDAKSIGGGKKWYTHIIDNLRLSRVVLVLASHESKQREWINFEAGLGEGSGSLVIPIAIKNFPLAQLSNPLREIQGRNIDELGAILDDISDKLGVTAAIIDLNAYQAEIRQAEDRLVYRSIVVRVRWNGRALAFTIENAGNIDIELLMLEVLIPSDIVEASWNPAFINGIDFKHVTRAGVPHRWFGCYSPRGSFRGIGPLLRPFITTSMQEVEIENFSIPLNLPLTGNDLGRTILFQVHAIGYTTEMQVQMVGSIPGIPAL
jgi:hypothetical protein